jgi:hypothetical protein
MLDKGGHKTRYPNTKPEKPEPKPEVPDTGKNTNIFRVSSLRT